jgi:hypothetical protein
MIQAVAVVALCGHQTPAATLEAVSAEVDSLSALRDSLQADVELVEAQVDSLKALQKELQAEQESEAVPEVFVVSAVVGNTIDATERDRYGLFPSVKEFVSATYYKRPDGSFYVEFVTRGSSGKKETATNDVVPAGISYVGSRIESAQ